MTEKIIQILLVEDEQAHVELILKAFEAHHVKAAFHQAKTLKEATAIIQEKKLDLVLLDFLLPDGNGLDLLPPKKEEAPFPFMVMTSHGDEKLAVDALKAGALDYVVKSADNLAAMPSHINRVLREWTLIQEHRKAEEALRLSEEKFRTIADYSMDLGFWLGVDGELLWTNRSIERLTGCTFQECLCQSDHIFAFIHEEDRPAIRKTLEKALAERTSGNNIPFRLRHKDNTIRWVSVSWQPIYSIRDGYLGIRASIRDIHNLKKTLDKLKEANHELDAFVYTVSHDLRTPLTPIIGFAQVLREQYKTQLDDSACEILGSIEQQGKNMLNLLEDLLRLARAGYVDRPEEAVDTDAVIQEILDSLNGRIGKVEIEIQKQPLPSVHLPRTLLAQAFENLIVNALLHAGKEGNPIEIGGDRDNGKVRFFVRDHGPGVPDDERKRIFDVFYRGNREGKVQGTGVGLATVRKIARQYGGFAWVEETLGGGATFWITFDDTSPLD